MRAMIMIFLFLFAGCAHKAAISQSAAASYKASVSKKLVPIRTECANSEGVEKAVFGQDTLLMLRLLFGQSIEV